LLSSHIFRILIPFQRCLGLEVLKLKALTIFEENHESWRIENQGFSNEFKKRFFFHCWLNCDKKMKEFDLVK
jgi:hypothetical protein